MRDIRQRARAIGLYTTHDAAEKIGRSSDTLERWRKQGIFVPGASQEFGSLTVPLYSDEDIEQLKLLSETIRPGRRRKE